MRIRFAFLVAVMCLFTVSSGQSAVFRVTTAEELQAALSQAQSNGETDTILVAAGTIVLSQELAHSPYQVPGHLTLAGEGAGLAIIDGGATAYGIRLDMSYGGGDVAVQGLTFHGSYLKVKTYSSGITVETSEFLGSVGTGLRAESTIGRITVRGNSFRDNGAGGLWYSSNMGGVTIERNDFLNNRGADGGGVSGGRNTSVFVSNNTFIGNSAGRCGGIALATRATAWLNGNVFLDNTAQMQGGGACVSAGALVIANNTFTDNEAEEGGGLFVGAGGGSIDNNIVWGNTASTGIDVFIVGDGSGLYFRNNNAPRVTTSVSPALLTRAANFSADPRLVDAGKGNLHLSSASTCIDRGLPRTDLKLDLDREPRIRDGNRDGKSVIDVGADEYFSCRTLTLIAPNGGESLLPGERYLATWGAPPGAAHYSVQVSYNGGATYNEIASGLTTTQFEWRVPHLAATANNCRMRVISYTSSGAALSRDTSNSRFTIRGSLF